MVIPETAVVHTRLGEDRCTLKDADSGYQASVCDGLGPRKEDSGHIALVNDWGHLQDLWSLKVVLPLKSYKEGKSRGLIFAESGGNENGRDSSLSRRSRRWEPPWTAARRDTLLSGQLSASDSGHVLKCRQVCWMGALCLSIRSPYECLPASHTP